MSLIFSHENCSLISHENYVNRIYQDASFNDGASPKYKIRTDLFDLNVPYRQEAADSEKVLKKRQRKILEKNADRVKHEHPHEYALVKFTLKNHFLLNTLFTMITIFVDRLRGSNKKRKHF